MSSKSFLIMVVLCFFVFSACSKNDDTSFAYVSERTKLPFAVSEDFLLLLDDAFNRRADIIRPTLEVLYPLIETRNTMYAVTLRDKPAAHMPSTHKIHQNFAHDDVVTLFIALAQHYGPYFYLGGDDVFLPVRDDILALIDGQDAWRIADLEQLLHTHLSSIITDNHFHINGMFLRCNTEFFQYHGAFERNDHGFRCMQSGRYVKTLLLPCRPDLHLDLHETFRFSADERGEHFFYAPVIMMSIADGETIPASLTIVYEDNTTQTVALAQLPKQRNDMIQSWSPNHSLEYVQGIPVVAIEGMGSSHTPNGRGRSEGRSFLRNANLYLQDEPVIILDLRGNGGGCGSLPTRWMYNVTGQLVPSNRIQLHARTYQNIDDVERTHIHPLIPFGDHHVLVDSGPDRIVPNNQLIIVLIDRFTASAGESMTDLAFNMENTLVIGQNTSGVLLTRSSASNFLPWSNIPVAFNSWLAIHPEGHFAEGIGYAPDIWVMGDALTATLNMLNHHIIQK